MGIAHAAAKATEAAEAATAAPSLVIRTHPRVRVISAPHRRATLVRRPNIDDYQSQASVLVPPFCCRSSGKLQDLEAIAGGARNARSIRAFCGCL